MINDSTPESWIRFLTFPSGVATNEIARQVTRAQRLDLCLYSQPWGVEHGIKGAPGKELLSMNLKTMACRHQRDAPADDVALLVILQIGEPHQPLLQFLQTQMKCRRKCGFLDGFSSCHLSRDRAFEVFLLTAQRFQKVYGNRIER